jgi:hypothetical protein
VLIFAGIGADDDDDRRLSHFNLLVGGDVSHFFDSVKCTWEQPTTEKRPRSKRALRSVSNTSTLTNVRVCNAVVTALTLRDPTGSGTRITLSVSYRLGRVIFTVINRPCLLRHRPDRNRVCRVFNRTSLMKPSPRRERVYAGISYTCSAWFQFLKLRPS